MHTRRSWATEDPNPAAARKEKARLVAEGERGVAKALDPEFVQRVRELDELEGRVGPREDADAGAGAGKEEEDEGAGRGKKRARIEPPPGATIVEEQAHNANAAPPPPPPLPAPAPAAGGILSAHAVDSLRYMAHLRQQKTGAPAPAAVAAAAPAKAKPAGLGALAAYGSDDESD